MKNKIILLLTVICLCFINILPVSAEYDTDSAIERTIEYEYGNSNTTENVKTGLNKRIEADTILSSLLGRPLIKVM